MVYRNFIWGFLVLLIFIMFIALLMLVATGIFSYFLSDRVSDQTVTRTTMWVVKRRILVYAHQNNQLPKSLANIPTLPRFDNSIKDAWGRSLQYQINENKTITLKSLGQDGLPGGAGENADIILSFPTHGADGDWSDPLVNWLTD